MLINLQGIGIWILIAVLKHVTGAQPGPSGTQIMHHFVTALWGKAQEDKRVVHRRESE